MAKVKNKKSSLADTYAKKRKQQMSKKTITPFEVHINRDKQKVLGRKSKADSGLPGIARTKAIAKRKSTLLLEYKVKDKDNIFLDRRIGEKNSGMTQEDKVMARFAAERIKAYNKKNIFNLNDDEVLTHRGQSLIDIEKYDDPRSDEDDADDDENRTGKLDKKFVADVHFGGGVLSKPDSEMSRKDLIDQLISESKKRKAERQKIREQTIDLTEKLDSEWRDLLPLVTSANKSIEKVEEKTKADDYDIAMRELKFEARGIPTDKLKSEEAIAKEEKIQLEKLEEARLQRMQGFSDEADLYKKHRSVDDLDDFHIEKIEEQSDNENSDNKSILIKRNDNLDDKTHEKDQEEETHTEEEQGNENDDTDDNDDNDNDEEAEESGNILKEENEIEISENENEKDDSEEGSEEEFDDDLSDLKVSESSENEEELQEKTNKPVVNDLAEKIACKKTEVEKVNITEKHKSGLIELEQNVNNVYKKNCDNPIKTNLNAISEINDDPKERETIMEKARKELPYTFKVPTSYQELQNLLTGQTPDYQSVIIERIIKCNHWKLAEKNKEKLLNLFSFLLQYLEDCISVNTTEELVKYFQIFDRLCPHFYDLTHANPEATKSSLRDILKEKHSQFESKIKVYPGLGTLMLFKLVSILYPTSDFRHPIVTPCLVFMSQILMRCKIKGKHDITKGLFVCTLILEYTVLNKRWAPSVINFLRGVIYVSLTKPFSQVIKVLPPFKSFGEVSNILVLEETHKKSVMESSSLKMQVKDFIEEEINDEFRIRTFVTAINLLCEFQERCSDLDAAFSIFEPIYILLTCGSVKRYPKSVRKMVKVLITNLEKFKENKLEYLVFDRKKPKALRMYEPRIEVVHDGKRHKPMSKAKAEKEKLLYKLKKETKSAIREIRRDTAFLSKVKIKQQIASDTERKRKVREIFGDAAAQQSELKKLKKK